MVLTIKNSAFRTKSQKHMIDFYELPGSEGSSQAPHRPICDPEAAGKCLGFPGW